VAGTPEELEKGIPEKIRETMVRFNVEEKQARLLLSFSAVLSSENFAKWKANLRRMQMEKASEILRLVEKAKNGDNKALAEAESRLQAILEARKWER
jgi:hypothetical protein